MKILTKFHLYSSEGEYYGIAKGYLNGKTLVLCLCAQTGTKDLNILVADYDNVSTFVGRIKYVSKDITKKFSCDNEIIFKELSCGYDKLPVVAIWNYINKNGKPIIFGEQK